MLESNGTNVLIPNTELANPYYYNGGVGGPNVDTLYSSGFFDLSGGNLIVTVPEVGQGRYWSFVFYDPFGDNFEVLGSIRGSSAGNYTLRWSRQHSFAYSEAMTIESPVAYGTLFIRILVRNNGTDLMKVRQIIDRSSLTKAETSKPPAGRTILPLSVATFANISTMSLARGILELTARTLDASLPINVTNPGAVVRELHKAGVYENSYKQPAGINLTAIADDALTMLTSSSNSNTQTLNNGWFQYALQGLYGSNYVARAQVAMAGTFFSVPSEALYPFHKPVKLSVAIDKAYLYTFSSKPPLGPTGFWSLTMYNASGYLIPNALNTYAIGDRSNITYPDGSLVYGNESNSSDQSFQVLVQSAVVSPPANWTSNWLPSPEKNGSGFEVDFRLYSPTPALTNGSWLYPEVVLIDAITG